MGFDKMAALTHKMEDVFELLRQRTAGVETEAIDTVFACLDVLSNSVDAIESTGQESLDPELLIARLSSLVGLAPPLRRPLVRPPPKLSSMPPSTPRAPPASAWCTYVCRSPTTR